MAILRKQKTSNFTTVNNYFINDPNLKPDGKGFSILFLPSLEYSFSTSSYIKFQSKCLSITLKK